MRATRNVLHQHLHDRDSASHCTVRQDA